MLSSGFHLGGNVAAQAAAHTAGNKSVTVNPSCFESNQMHCIPEVESDKAHLVPFLAPQGNQEAAGRMQWPPAQGKMERAAS